MSEFEHRLKACAERYRTELQATGGGVGEDTFPGAPVSIVNTAEVLTVLHAAGIPFQASPVQLALKYIADKVIVHPLQRGTNPEARGRSTRYAAFGLLGLTSYPEAIHAPSLEEGQRTCVAWLTRYELKTGGWSESAREANFSPLSTQAAVEALERLCPRAADLAKITDLCRRARAACLGLGNVESPGHTTVRWWPRGGGDKEPSPSATALAVLLLAGGNAHQKKAAREGVNWLIQEIESWRTGTDGDAHSRTANWVHMTYSLGLRAVLAGAEASPRRPELQPSIEFLDALWNDEQAGWSHGTPGADVTPSGCQAAVLAAQALEQASTFDPSDLLASPPKRRWTKLKSPARREVILGVDNRLTVIEAGGRILVEGFPLKPRASGTTLTIVRLLMERQIVNPGAPLEMVSMTTAELVEQVAEEGAVLKAIDRLNTKLARAASFEVGTLAELIQPVNSTRDRAERRWRIDATKFTFAE